MVGWMECLSFRDLLQIGTSLTWRARYTIHVRGPLLPALRCRLTRERWQQHKSHTSTALALGDQIQPSILLKKISVQRSWQSQVQADSAANSPLAFPGHYTRMARGIRSELFRNSHALEAKELSIQASSTATGFSELSLL